MRQYQLVGNAPVAVPAAELMRNLENDVTILSSKSIEERASNATHIRCILDSQRLQLAMHHSCDLTSSASVCHG